MKRVVLVAVVCVWTCACSKDAVARLDASTGGFGDGGFAMDASERRDAGARVDAARSATDASVDAGSSATDASVDAGSAAVDAGSGAVDAGSDAGPSTRYALYAHIGGKLVRVNPDDGTFAEIGTTGQSYIVLAWDSRAGVMRVITDILTAPRLGTIDLCTSAITPGPRMMLGASGLTKAESLAQDPETGIFYAAVDADGSAPSVYLSESTATVDIATGAVTVIGAHRTLQNDGDSSTFIGSTLYLLDVNQPTNAAIYTIDEATAAATLVHTLDASVVRLAYDPSRSTLFIARGNPSATTRSIATLTPETGVFADLGYVVPSTMYAGQQFTGLAAAPAPASCP